MCRLSPIAVVISSAVLEVLGSCSTSALTAQPPSIASDACLVVDTDSAADDLRAIALLQSRRKVVAVITTGGGTHAGVGAAIVRRIYHDANVIPPVILVGLQDVDGEQVANAAFEQAAEHPYGRSVDFQAESPASGLRDKVVATLAHCTEVALIVLGPWTSVTSYLPLPGLATVVAQGRPDQAGLAGMPVSWNCRYDFKACKQAQGMLAPLTTSWIDISVSEEAQWPLTAEMFNSFSVDGFPGVIHRLANLDVRRIGWRGLWDDLVALSVIDPGLFRRRGTHFEPAGDRAKVKQVWNSVLRY